VTGFVDETVIRVSAGSGGNGAVSFRREKFVPRGGPDGGDGGKGGDVVIVVRRNLKTLSHLKMKRVFAAENGRQGSGNRKQGRDGNDVEVAVPPGTILHDADNGELIADLLIDGERRVLLKGGRGGKGNARFATSTNQAPRHAEDGGEGSERSLRVELHLIADIGLVGHPNAGKSTLLSVLTNAHPEIADYPFTTRVPHLGLLRLAERDLILADIPGLIEGASEGRGLGTRFLKHVSRCAVLLYMVDLSQEDPAGSIRTLERELEAYSEGLFMGKPRVIAGTKMDLEGATERLPELTAAFPGEPVVGISSHTHLGLQDLERALMAAMESR